LAGENEKRLDRRKCLTPIGICNAPDYLSATQKNSGDGGQIKTSFAAQKSHFLFSSPIDNLLLSFTTQVLPSLFSSPSFWDVHFRRLLVIDASIERAFAFANAIRGRRIPRYP
jgi:hypothetical protein